MSFSKRMGLVPQKAIQLNDIDSDLRNSLWNIYYLRVLKNLQFGSSSYTREHTFLFNYCVELWANFYKQRVETVPNQLSNCLNEIRERFITAPWYRVFDQIEFDISYLKTTNEFFVELGQNYINDCNKILEREVSGYRIIDDKLAPISNEIELKEVEDAIFKTPYPNVNIHLRAALEKLSDKVRPDFRNSIKESISAVETLSREITGENTLGAAIKRYERSGITLNQQFKDALEKLYAYTNNKETGIRHSILDAPQTPAFEEAKFMLITCSAFINYLIAKMKNLALVSE